MANSARVVVVDDEPQLLLMLESLLGREGFDVFAAPDAMSALRHLESNHADVILLDWELPDMDGVTACGAIRLLVDTRIIMLTARGSEADRVAGITAGVDDYVAKPFLPNELIARIRATLRRKPMAIETRPEPTQLFVGPLMLNWSNDTATFFGTKLDLTALEFAVLRHLVQHRQSVVPIGELLQLTFGETSETHRDDILAIIASIRKQLRSINKTVRVICSVRGSGYRINPELL